jgi:hypothetical protein
VKVSLGAGWEGVKSTVSKSTVYQPTVPYELDLNADASSKASTHAGVDVHSEFQ